MKFLLSTLLLGFTACVQSDPGPAPPPIPATDSPEDGPCHYRCADYHYSAGECYGGWQCDAAGACLAYRGTPDAPSSCPSACVPTTCASLGDNCGTPDDGCGGTLTCGACSGADTCGGGGTPDVCGHQPTPPPPQPIDPLDPASCTGPVMSMADVDALLPAGRTSTSLTLTTTAHIQTRQCAGQATSSMASCTTWTDTGHTPRVYATIGENTNGTASIHATLEHYAGHYDGALEGNPTSSTGPWIADAPDGWDRLFALYPSSGQPVMSPTMMVLKHCLRWVLADPPTPNTVGESWTEYRAAVVSTF